VDADSRLAVSGVDGPFPREPGVDVAALFRDNQSRLIGLSTAILLDPIAAEEVVQDAFEGLQRHVGHVENPGGYLQRSVVNSSISIVRRRRVVARHPMLAAPPASLPEIDEAWAAVTRLPVKQRAVVVLRFWQDQSIDAIAEILAWPAGSGSSLATPIGTVRR
jgi:DNA-directed RNA polymerase specialized sigma24 family protein